MACGATLTAQSISQGRLTLPMSAFFTGYRTTTLPPDAVITRIHIPIPASGTKELTKAYKQAKRKDDDIAVLTAAFRQVPHLSALKQNTGEAQYTDDIPKQDRELYGALVLSRRAHAKLVKVDWTPALGGGLALGYVDINSIPKESNLWGSVVKDEPFFADGEVFCHGQPIGLVYAETALQAQAAAKAVKIVYEDLPTILTIDEAIAANSFFRHGKMLKKGYALKHDMNDIWSKCDRVFEGVLAVILAVAAKKTWRPVRCMLNRDEDMMTSGQRHPVQCRWKVGTATDGKLVALEADVYNNGGFSQDMSAVAEGLNIPIDELRRKNLYKTGDFTPFLQKIDQDWHIPMMLEQLRKEVEYDTRRAAIEKFNKEHRWRKRGMSMIPTKFGLSFATAVHLNQATASVKIYADGSILLHHGGTEMGQGLYTKMCQVAAQEVNESLWTRSGQLFTRGPGTYKIPGFSDIPQEFNVSFLQGVDWSHLRSIQSSKGVGEPPLFLGATVLFALREAVCSARRDNGVEEVLTLDSPATAERLRLAAGDAILKAGTVVPKEGERNFFVSVA
ncbi:xanthine dehydrogenase-like protein [Diplocarpon rosae]|nr:xanthine dehydrogenase-like protein [Diplocarpon rosae]